ncbi:MAG TPA: glycosyltransferase family 4 protein [Verrucomicrobiota bacterium]|nr:glycosyltransferase family 4 protein [Verrucomicrobiota bacterium]HQL78058.1 glycosyltransferase family 4 protein [Verrucomicrobiota bacterium]
MTFLLLNQTFHPDVMATGQYLTDVALRLIERGHQVTVVTGRRAYDQPRTQFPKEEMWRGIRVCRVGSTGFGKGAKWRRAADFASFLALASLRLARLPRPDVVVALTSPPLISLLGAGLARLRRSRFFYWVMDFNPDEAIAAGWLRPNSPAAKVLDWISRVSLRRAHRIIALDRFMRERIVAKGIARAKVLVIPPWSHDTEVTFDAQGRERFRKAHGLDGKFVVMYSGNHSPCHPLDTLLAAAERLKEDKSIVFCFVGGGSEYKRVKRWAAEGKLTQVVCLPYQPLSEVSNSLSAADLQVVVMGDPFIGLVHPCKIYNILNVGAPVLYIGPRVSHISEIVEKAPHELVCLAAQHGEVDKVVKHIQQLSPGVGYAARQPSAAVRSLFSREVVLPKLVAALETG